MAIPKDDIERILRVRWRSANLRSSGCIALRVRVSEHGATLAG